MSSNFTKISWCLPYCPSIHSYFIFLQTSVIHCKTFTIFIWTCCPFTKTLIPCDNLGRVGTYIYWKFIDVGLSMIVRVNVALNRTVVSSDWRFDNLCGSHLQNQSELYDAFSWTCLQLNSGYWRDLSIKTRYAMVLVACQLRRDVIGYEDSWYDVIVAFRSVYCHS